MPFVTVLLLNENNKYALPGFSKKLKYRLNKLYKNRLINREELCKYNSEKSPGR